MKSVGVNPICHINISTCGRFRPIHRRMSQFRVEKRRAEAELTLSTGGVVRGCFFLASATATQVGPERVADLLNAGSGFFPFSPTGRSADHTIVINRAHVVLVKLLEPSTEAQRDPGYEVATERRV